MDASICPTLGEDEGWDIVEEQGTQVDTMVVVVK